MLNVFAAKWENKIHGKVYVVSFVLLLAYLHVGESV